MPSQWPVGRRGAASPRPMWRSFLQPGRITNVRSTISWMTTSGCSRSTSSWSKEYSQEKKILLDRAPSPVQGDLGRGIRACPCRWTRPPAGSASGLPLEGVP